MRNREPQPVYLEDRPISIARMVLHHRFLLHLLLDIVLVLASTLAIIWKLSSVDRSLSELLARQGGDSQAIEKALDTQHEQGREILKQISLIDAWKREAELIQSTQVKRR